MKVMVTGGSGFVGSNVMGHLREKGFEVFNYDIVEGLDITDYEQLKKCLDDEEFDMVYHLAAQAFLGPGEEDPYRDAEINVFGMINLLRCLEEHDIPMVYTSSGAVYGISPVLPHVEDAICIPVSNYGVSKLAAEKYLKKWVVTKGIDARIVRFSSVYGPGRKHGPVNIFINKALRNEPLTIYGTGAQTRDMVHIDDALIGLELVLERGRRGEIYNIGTGEEYSVAEVAKIIQKQRSVSITYVKHDMGPFDLARSWYNIEKAKKLGYRPRMDLELGINSTMFDIENKPLRN